MAIKIQKGKGGKGENNGEDEFMETASKKEIMTVWFPKPVPILPTKGTMWEKTFRVLDDSDSSTCGKVYFWFMLTIIGASCLSMVMESHEEYRYPHYGDEDGHTAPIFFVLESVAIGFFTVDYFARVVLAPYMPIEYIYQDKAERDHMAGLGIVPTPWQKLRAYMGHSLNIIDAVAIIPYYLEIVLEGVLPSLAVVRVVRIVRVFRVFKASKNMKVANILGYSVADSAHALGALLFMIAINTVICGTLIYYCEKGSYNASLEYFERDDMLHKSKEETPFKSVAQSFWWVVTTFTTVGYGDIVPTSTGGRVVAILMMLIGIIIIALPMTIIGQKFTEEYAKSLKDDDTVERLERRKRDLVRAGWWPQVRPSRSEVASFIESAFVKLRELAREEKEKLAKEEKEFEKALLAAKGLTPVAEAIVGEEPEPPKKSSLGGEGGEEGEGGLDAIELTTFESIRKKSAALKRVAPREGRAAGVEPATAASKLEFRKRHGSRVEELQDALKKVATLCDAAERLLLA